MKAVKVTQALFVPLELGLEAFEREVELALSDLGCAHHLVDAGLLFDEIVDHDREVLLERFGARMRELAPELVDAARPEYELSKGLPPTRILEIAERVDARLLVLGNRGRVLATSEPIRADVTDRPVQFTNNYRPGRRPLRLRFELESAKLYSFR